MALKKDDRVEQCLRSYGSEFQMWGPKQEKVRKAGVLRLYCWISSMRVSEEEFPCESTDSQETTTAVENRRLEPTQQDVTIHLTTENSELHP